MFKTASTGNRSRGISFAVGYGLSIISLIVLSSAACDADVSKANVSSERTISAQASALSSLQQLDSSAAILHILPLFAHDVRQPLKDKKRIKYLVRDLAFIGVALQLDENEVAAAQIFSIAHLLDPDNIMVTAYLADNLNRTGGMQEAQKILSALPAQTKIDPIIIRTMAMDEYRKTNYIAVKQLTECGKAKPGSKGDARLAVIEARADLKLGLTKTSVAAFRHAAALTNNQYCRLLWLAIAAAVDSNDVLRQKLLGQAASVFPNDPVWQNDLAAALGSKNSDEAFQLVSKATHCPRLFSRSFYTMSGLFESKSRSDDALATLNYIMVRRPRSAEGHFALARYERAHKHNQEALALFNQGLVLNPYAGYARIELADYYTELGREAEALDQVRIATVNCPNCLPAWRTLGDYLRKRKQLEEGVKAYAHALQVIPQPASDLNVFAKHEAAQAHAGLGAIYYDQGDRQAAIEQAQTFNQMKFVPKLENMASWLRIRPDKLPAHDGTKENEMKQEQELQNDVLLADMLYEMKAYDQSCREYEKAIELNPEDGDLHSYLLNVCAESGKWAAALREDMALSKSVVGKVPDQIGNMFKKAPGEK